VVPNRQHCLLSFFFFLSFLFWSTDSLASISDVACAADSECGVGKCIDLQCKCPPGYVNAPEAPCVSKMRRKDHETPFLLELFLGWIFPAGLAHEQLWQLAGIRLGVEGIAAFLGSGYYYAKHHWGITTAALSEHVELGERTLDLDQVYANVETPKVTYRNNKGAKILKALAITAGSLHAALWLLTTAGFGEAEWPDPNFKRAIHLDDGQKADLVIIGSKLAESAYVTLERFTAISCALKEGCVKGIGERRLLRFDSYIYNIGNGDFAFAFEDVIPEWSPCHQHFHAPEATAYFLKQELYNSSNSSVALRFGHKQGYCFRDTVQIAQNHSAKFGCGIPKLTRQYTQGITAGWADIYHKTLDCQFVDITGLPPGTYRLVLTVNPKGVYYQDEPENNITIVTVVIPPIDETRERTKEGVPVEAWVSKEYDEDN
jgi:Lysyl oxidase